MLEVIISNNIRILGASTPLRAEITKRLTMSNPEYERRKKRGKPTWGLDKKIKFYIADRGALIAPRGFEDELKTVLKTFGKLPKKVIKYRQEEGRPADFGSWNNDFILRPEQKPAIEEVNKYRNGVLVSPAGSGKTIMGMRWAYEKGRTTLWLTHTKDLMYQSRKRAKSVMEVGEVGIIGDGKREWGDGNLIIATVQTLNANEDLVHQLNQVVGSVIIDEAHHFPAEMFIEVAGQFKAKNFLGLTATPDRKDKLEKYMYLGIGPKRFEIKRDNLYEEGRLVKPEVKFIYTDFTYETASQREGTNVDAGGEDLDYHDLMNELLTDQDRAELISKHILDAAPIGFSIVLAENIRYCYKLKQLVKELAKKKWGTIPRMEVVHGGLTRYAWHVAGSESEARRLVKAGEAVDYRQKKGKWKVKVEKYTEEEYNDWQVTKADRREILEAAEDRELDILFATQLAREGLDYPHLAVGHMVTPKRGDRSGRRDGAAVEQEIGRIMRPDPNNENKKAVWYDYVDYNNGVFKNQYYSRRKVYKRLGLKCPRKPRKDAKQIEDILDGLNMELPF